MTKAQEFAISVRSEDPQKKEKPEDGEKDKAEGSSKLLKDGKSKEDGKEGEELVSTFWVLLVTLQLNLYGSSQKKTSSSRVNSRCLSNASRYVFSTIRSSSLIDFLRHKESNTELYRPALETLRTLIRTSTSSMTSVPKPLKFLRPHYPDLQALYEAWPISEDKVFPQLPLDMNLDSPYFRVFLATSFPFWQ